eukprot:GSChrysophyteH2.ASY1.ANO1.856.1 assembled CDS
MDRKVCPRPSSNMYASSTNDDDHQVQRGEDTPAYLALEKAGVLSTQYRRDSTAEIFTGDDIKANSDSYNNWKVWLSYNCLLPGIGCIAHSCIVSEFFVKAGHVGLLMDSSGRYLFAEPGMHNISHIEHGDRTIVIVEQGFIGYASDNGQPVLLPPGIHVWMSNSLRFVKSHPLDDHCIKFGPYTLLTVDEGYAAVTQNNGKQVILPGGHTHFLSHKNWKFEKFLTLKINTDDLESIVATSADNINIEVTSTVNWKIADAELAAIMAAETMSITGKASDASNDLKKLRRDVLKQALASLSSFIGSVNYSASDPMATSDKDDAMFLENPLYNQDKMETAMEHANSVTRTYGVEIMSINIISARPDDKALNKTLASGAVAAAEALQAETAAQGRAQALLVEAKAGAEAISITAQANKHAAILKSEGEAEGIRLIGSSVITKDGQEAMKQRLAQSYIEKLSEMASNSKMMIVPQNTNDINGVLATALSLTTGIQREGDTAA